MKISMIKMKNHCFEVSELLRALSHPRRLLILGHLTQGKKTVSELQGLCGISQSQLSQFLNKMLSDGLVAKERQGKYQFYSLKDTHVLHLIESIQKIFC
jgi:ArsR family transcriptional regulator, virulence genes transcriptional regulator